MAKKPDFTEKLLNDLRRRKEHMAMSQTSKGSNQMSADKYRNFKQPSQGSKEINLHENVGFTTKFTNKWFGNGHNRSFSMMESSKEIIPIGRARTSENIGDLSMALAFALKSSGKHRKIGSSGNPMSSFLHHIGRSVDFGEMDRRLILPVNGRFPTLSHLHIKEISKGAQKLNQILNACYNGLNCDKYSVEIGKELLKGAMDLEESLRMLVNLQEASEYMVSPQRKHRIRLVEVEDNNSEAIEEVNKKKKLERPKFSFDRPTKNPLEDVQEITKSSILKQRQLALSSPREPQKINSEKQALTTSNVVSHRRSASCGSASSTIATFSNLNKHTSSDSRPEKGRIPNVIAKLMGLEELPPQKESKTGSHNDPSVKQGTCVDKDSKKYLQEITKKIEPVIMNPEKLYSQAARKKVLRADNVETDIVLHADKIVVTQNQKLETEVHEGKSHWKDQKNASIIVKKQEKKTRQDKPNHKEQKITGRGGSKEKVLEDDLQRVAPQTRKHPEATYIKQEKAATKETMLQKEKINADEKLLTVNNQQKLPHDSPRQPRYKLRKSESQDVKLQAVEKEQLTAKNKLHIRKPKGTEMMLKRNLQKKLPNTNQAILVKNSKESVDAMPPKALKSNHHEDPISQGNATNLKRNMKKSPKENLEEQRPDPTNKETDEERVAAPITKVVITKSLHIPSTQNKVDNTESPKSVIPIKVKEELSRKTGSPHRYDKSLKQQTSVLEEPEQRRHERNDAVVSIIPTKEAEASMQPLNLTQDLHKIAELTPIPGNSIAEEYQMLKELEIITLNTNIQKITTEVSDSFQASTILLCGDQNNAIQIKGLHESSMISISKSLQQDQLKSPKSETPGSLTENENHLKQILIKSQLFINAAEALFKLQIPVGILHGSAHNCQDEDSKLLLDCGYEVMKRKGKRQELTFYPCVSISIGSKKVKCLDDLVKALHGDLETFKFFTENGNIQYDAAYCLHKMLQNDIQNSNSDVNCMWDFGWSDMMFACLEKEEVIRDVEKHVLNGLIDDITRDFLHISVVI
ncbi:protein of unknown function DUF4378 [Macleaya cordata]|uniref:DUF3741 domain-containing protein n=1 Tax=Macleaya cordata TaxID=56857 RepID=A0A200R7K4_MACCD|nr:protein of unknown function DUF4378 [Macleaya cordata]